MAPNAHTVLKREHIPQAKIFAENALITVKHASLCLPARNVTQASILHKDNANRFVGIAKTMPYNAMMEISEIGMAVTKTVRLKEGFSVLEALLQPQIPVMSSLIN